MLLRDIRSKQKVVFKRYGVMFCSFAVPYAEQSWDFLWGKVRTKIVGQAVGLWSAVLVPIPPDAFTENCHVVS